MGGLQAHRHGGRNGNIGARGPTSHIHTASAHAGDDYCGATSHTDVSHGGKTTFSGEWVGRLPLGRSISTCAATFVAAEHGWLQRVLHKRFWVSRQCDSTSTRNVRQNRVNGMRESYSVKVCL